MIRNAFDERQIFAASSSLVIVRELAAMILFKRFTGNFAFCVSKNAKFKKVSSL